MSSALGAWCAVGATPLEDSLVDHFAASHSECSTSKENEELDEVVSNVSTLFNSSKTRIKGLILLKCILTRKVISKGVIVEHGHVWLSSCINLLKHPNVTAKEKHSAFIVIRELLEISYTIHELDRSKICSFLPDVVESLEKSKPVSHISALLCVETILSKYSKASGIHRSSIERFLVQFLDSQEKNNVIYAAKCAHLLQQIAGGGQQGINFQTSWKNQIVLYMHAINEITKSISSYLKKDEMYENASYFASACNLNRSEYTTIKVVDQLPLNVALRNICFKGKLYDLVKRGSNGQIENEIDTAASNKILIIISNLFTRLKNLLVFMQSLLVDPYPVAKCFKPHLLLDVLLQCMSFKLEISDKNQTLEMITISSFIPNLYILVLQTIEALILCIHANILPYTSFILKMVIGILDRTKTEECNYRGFKPYKNIRKAAYNTLQCLFSTLHTVKPLLHDGDQGFEDKLIDNILIDVTFVKPSLQIVLKSTVRLKPTKKTTRNKYLKSVKDNNLDPKAVKNTSEINYEEIVFNNIDLIKSALLCLQHFIQACGVFLKQSTYKTLQHMLVKEIYDRSTPELKKDALFKALYAISAFQPCNINTISPFCLEIFSRNQHNQNNELKVFCNNAALNTINSIRGYAPTLCFPFSHDGTSVDVNNVNTNITKRFTKSSDTADEVIDIDKFSKSNTRSAVKNSLKRKHDKPNSKTSPRKTNVGYKRVYEEDAPVEISSSSDNDCVINEFSSSYHIQPIVTREKEGGHQNIEPVNELIMNEVDAFECIALDKELEKDSVINDFSDTDFIGNLHTVENNLIDFNTNESKEPREENENISNNSNEKNCIKESLVDIDSVSNETDCVCIITLENDVEEKASNVKINQINEISSSERHGTSLEEMLSTFTDEPVKEIKNDV